MSTFSNVEFIPLHDLESRTPSEVGGKAFGLGLLNAKGFPIPNGVVVGWLNPEDGLSLTDRDRERLAHELTRIRQSGADSFIVRSSSPQENVAGSISPGRFLTLEIDANDDEDIVRAILTVANDILSKSESDSDARPYVIVQEFIRCAVGGVLCSIDPSRPDQLEFGIIEFAKDGPMAITQGRVPDATISFFRSTPTESIHWSQAATSWLSTKHLTKLVKAAYVFEIAYDGAVSIEWGVCSSGRISFFQVRPADNTCRPSDLVIPLSESDSPSPQITALRMHAAIDAGVPNMSIVTHRAFQTHASCRGTLDSNFDAEFTAKCESILNVSDASIRPTLSAPDGRNHSLPQTGRLTSMVACREAILRYWEYVATNGLAVDGVRVEAIVAPWFDVYATALVEFSRSRIAVQSLFGLPEGLENLPCDTHIVDVASSSIAAVEIATKSRYVRSHDRTLQPVDSSEASRPVLSKNDVLNLVGLITKVCSDLNTARLEVLYVRSDRGRRPPLIWQIDAGLTVGALGFVVAIEDVYDDPDAIVVATAQIVRKEHDLFSKESTCELVWLQLEGVLRDPSMANRLATKLRQVTDSVLLTGSSLSHIATVLRSHNLQVFTTSDQPPDSSTALVSIRTTYG